MVLNEIFLIGHFIEIFCGNLIDNLIGKIDDLVGNEKEIFFIGHLLIFL